MIEIKKYMALDGTVWDSKEACAYHEKLDVEQFYEWAMKIKAYCSYNANCQNCPFYDKNTDEFPCMLGVIGENGNFIPKHWFIDEFESDE
jgi:hypothetical protein